MSLGSQRGGSCGTVLPALSKVFMSVCFLPASLPSSLSCCSELQKELGTVPASISSKQHIQVSAESVYRPQIYCGPVAVGKFHKQSDEVCACFQPRYPSVSSARQLRNMRCNSSFSPQCPEFNPNGQWCTDSSVWSLPSHVLPVTGPVRGGKKS